MQGKNCALDCRSVDEGLSEEESKLPALLCKQLLIGKDQPDNPINMGKSVYNKSEPIDDAD